MSHSESQDEDWGSVLRTWNEDVQIDSDETENLNPISHSEPSPSVSEIRCPMLEVPGIPSLETGD